MAKYLWKVSYSVPGMRGVLQEGGTARRTVAEKAVQSAGGRMESFYFAFGDADVYTIVDFPDVAACAAAAMRVTAAGGAKVETTVLIDPEDVDEATTRELDYRPPGES